MDEQAGLTGFIDRQSRHILDHCTQCGKCVDACPMTVYHDALPGADSKAVVGDILQVLAGRPHGELAEAWASVCTASGSCIAACPEDVNPMQMLRLAQIKLLGATGGPECIQDVHGDDYFRRLGAVTRAVVPPEDLKRLAPGPSEVKPGGVVFWYGCNAIRHPDMIDSAADILRLLDYDVSVVGGPAYCCGYVVDTHLDQSETMATRSLQRFENMQPELLITFCPSCQMQLNDFTLQYQEASFAMAHLTQILHRHREQLAARMQPLPGRRLALHTHLGFNHEVPVNRLVRELLEVIPGVEVLDGPPPAPGYMCSSLRRVPAAARDIRAGVTAFAHDQGATDLVTIFHTCQRGLCDLEPGGLRVIHYANLLAEALGTPRPDIYKAYKQAGSEERLRDLMAERGTRVSEADFQAYVRKELLGR